MSYISISQLEELTGVKAHTLRIWEKRYNILRPRRDECKKRYYDQEDVAVVKSILYHKSRGVKLSQIARMDRDEVLIAEEQKSIAEFENLSILDQILNSIQALNESNMDKILDRVIEEKGFEYCLNEVIYPIEDQLALLMLTGSLSRVHFNFFNNVIRHKTISQKDQLPQCDNCKELFLFFLFVQENQNLSIYYLQYLLKKRGFQVSNIGYSTIEEVTLASELVNPNYIVTNIDIRLTREQAEEQINELSRRFPTKKIILMGFAAIKMNIHMLHNVTLITSHQEFLEFINQV